MRHGKKNNHLGRTASHRKSLLSNLANSLILNKRIVTTLAKAKELRKYVEPILTKSKEDSTHNRRIVFSYLKNKESIKALFGDVSEKIANRNGGYTRIIKLGTRSGDAAETAMIELVDYNELLLSLQAEKPAKTRRSRRSSGGSARVAPAAAVVSEVVSDAQVVDESPVTEDVNEVPAAEITEETTVAEDSAPAAVEESPEMENSAAESADENISDETTPDAAGENPEEGSDEDSESSSGETEEKPEA